MVGVARENDTGNPLLPDVVQAGRLFDGLAAVPADATEPGTPAAMFARARRGVYEGPVTQALAHSVVPKPRVDDASMDRLTRPSSPLAGEGRREQLRGQRSASTGAGSATGSGRLQLRMLRNDPWPWACDRDRVVCPGWHPNPAR